MGQQSWFIGSLRTPNIFVYSFVRRRAAGIPKASQSLPEASQSLPKHAQSLPKLPKASPKPPKASQSIPKASQKLPKASPKPPQITPDYQRDSPDAFRADTLKVVVFSSTVVLLFRTICDWLLGALYQSRQIIFPYTNRANSLNDTKNIKKSLLQWGKKRHLVRKRTRPLKSKKGRSGNNNQRTGNAIYRAVEKSEEVQRKRPPGPWFPALCLTRDEEQINR